MLTEIASKRTWVKPKRTPVRKLATTASQREHRERALPRPAQRSPDEDERQPVVRNRRVKKGEAEHEAEGALAAELAVAGHPRPPVRQSINRARHFAFAGRGPPERRSTAA